MMSSELNNPQGIPSAPNSVERIRSLFRTKTSQNGTVRDDESFVASSSSTKQSGETYHAWGVRWSGNAGANHSALSPALQSCHAQNIREQNQDQAIQEQNQQNLQTQIATKEGQRDGERIKLEDFQRRRIRLCEKIDDCQQKIDNIKSNDGTNIMAKVNFTIGAFITILLAAYLFVFYSSASFSAFFGNNNITGAGDAIFDPKCYSEAVANGFGQFLFIILMPVVFLGLGFLIHQFGESEKGFAKYAKICGLYLVTFIFDALLAFEISQKVYEYTTLSEDEYTVTMAFNSPNFWIVIFAGFVAYVIWGLVFDFTLQHFDNMNAHTKEIKVLEDQIKSTKLEIDKLDKNISEVQLSINNLETEIAGLQTRLHEGTLIDRNVLKEALSSFFMGWISFMDLAAKPQEEKDRAHQTYNQFIANL